MFEFTVIAGVVTVAVWVFYRRDRRTNRRVNHEIRPRTHVRFRPDVE
jgi:hypothetical protein